MKPIETGSAFRPGIIGVAAMYLGLAAFVFLLAFCNLDSRPFWGDEAETALLAKNVLKFGLPKVDNGVNHISLHGDKFDARDGLWTWSPWLQDYIAAASFAVFGESTWAGRAPFAFIGWLSVIFLGFVAWKLYGRHRIALGAMFLLGTSEVFLLHIRQCRYYSITVLAETALIYGIYQILAKNKTGAWFMLAALLVQFYCNYTSAIANLPALIVLAFRLFRQDRVTFLTLPGCAGIFLVLAVPWLLFSETWRQGSAEGRDSWTHLLRFYAWQFHFHFLPWCFVLLPIGGWILHWLAPNRADVSQVSKSALRFLAESRDPSQRNRFMNQGKDEGLLNTPTATTSSFEGYLLLLMVLYVPVLLVMPLAFSRYLLPLLPVACLLVAVWIFRHIKWTAVALAILMVQSLSNVFAVATDPFAKQYPIRSPFADFLFSSLLPYEDRLTDLLKFFRQNARSGDTLVSWDPEFPLAFYTHLKIVDARLTSDPFHPLPNWILPESATGDLNEKHELPDALKSHYEKIVVAVHNSPQVDTIPEPEAYALQTAANMSSFVIYRLKNEN